MSETKKSQYLNQYKDFMSTYSQEWRYTHLGLYKSGSNIVIDTYYYSGEYTYPESDGLDDTIRETVSPAIDDAVTSGDISHVEGIGANLVIDAATGTTIETEFGDIKTPGAIDIAETITDSTVTTVSGLSGLGDALANVLGGLFK